MISRAAVHGLRGLSDRALAD